MTLQPEPLPLSDKVVFMEGRKAGLMTLPWVNSLSQMVQVIAETPTRVALESLTEQSASIAATALPIPEGASGLYRVTYYMRKTTEDPVSSSFQLTLAWTDNGQNCTKAFAAVTGVPVTTNDSQTYTVDLDSASPLTYAVTYASNTAGLMKFKLSLVVETVAV